MSNVFKAIDKAPFAGKFAVRDRVVEYQQAGPSQEKPCYDKTMRFLGFMVGAHALQAKMGLDAAQTHMGQFMHNGHMIDALAGGGRPLLCGCEYARKPSAGQPGTENVSSS